MIKETKKKNKGRKKQTNTGVEPTETFTSTKQNHVETELTYKDTTEVFGVLTTCLVCLEHAAIKGSLELMRGGGNNAIQTGVK